MQPRGAGPEEPGGLFTCTSSHPPLTQTAGKGTVQTHEGGGTEQSALKENASHVNQVI